MTNENLMENASVIENVRNRIFHSCLLKDAKEDMLIIKLGYGPEISVYTYNAPIVR